jgi:predicted alpha/beta hydrolase family esterase
MAHGDGAEQPGDRADPSDPTALEALHSFASAHVDVATSPTTVYAHREIYTGRGLLTVLSHQPTGDRVAAAIVACGGALGGVLGPGHALYHHLGERWAGRGVPVLRVGYRQPNELDQCAHDVACAVELARDAGAERVVVMGHSFGGAVAVRVGVGLDPLVTGVVTFATQSAGCEAAAGLRGKPLLLFHGERDEILPVEASEMVRMLAGAGEVVRLPGDGHLLAKSGDVLWERLEAWLPDPLGLSAGA